MVNGAVTNISAPQQNPGRLKAAVEAIELLKSELSAYKQGTDRRLQVLYAQNKVLQGEIQLLKARVKYTEDVLNIEEEVAAEGENEAQESSNGVGEAVIHDVDAEEDTAVVASEQAARSKGIRVRETQLFTYIEYPRVF